MIRLLKYRSVDFKNVIFVNPGPIPNSFLDSQYKKNIKIIDFYPNKSFTVDLL